MPIFKKIPKSIKKVQKTSLKRILIINYYKQKNEAT